MAGSRLAAWNPSNSDQFALYDGQLALWNVSHVDSIRQAKVASVSKAASHVSCMDWQHVEDHSLLAYGSTSGNIGLVKWDPEGTQEVSARCPCT